MESFDIGVLARYNLTGCSFKTMLSDYIRFNQKYPQKKANISINSEVKLNYSANSDIFPNDFISCIITNYIRCMQHECYDELKENLINLFNLNHPKRKISSSGRITIVKGFYEAVISLGICSHKKFKKSRLIDYILESYSSLDLSSREKIYFYEKYICIQNALENGKWLTISMMNNKSESRQFDYIPKRLEIDDNSLSYYLVGFSRECNTENLFTVYPIKLSRIISCSLRSEQEICDDMFKFKLQLDNYIERFGVAYTHFKPNDKIEKIKIRLTDYGYNQLYLRIINHQRPIPVRLPEKVVIDENNYYELEFDCSLMQIRNYFFRFGKHVKFLTPDSLREDYLKWLKQAIENM